MTRRATPRKKQPVGRPAKKDPRGGFRERTGRKRKKDKKRTVSLYYRPSVVFKMFYPEIKDFQKIPEKQMKEAYKKLIEYIYSIIPPE